MTTYTSKALVDLIKTESELLKEYVSALTPEELGRPSPCELWDVGEVIAHLMWFAETYGGMMKRGLRGDLSPAEGFPAEPGTLRGPDIAELYGRSAIELRRRMGQALLPAFCERYDWLNAMLQGIGPDDWDKPCYHTLRIRPVESFVPVIVAELAVHEWDIRSTIKPPAQLLQNTLPALMAKLPSNRRPWSVPFEAAGTSYERVCYRFDLEGTVSSRQDVIVEDGKASLAPAGDATADVSVRCQSEIWALLVYGRLTLESAAASGLAKVEGEGELVSSVDRWLNSEG